MVENIAISFVAGINWYVNILLDALVPYLNNFLLSFISGVLEIHISRRRYNPWVCEPYMYSWACPISCNECRIYSARWLCILVSFTYLQGFL